MKKLTTLLIAGACICTAGTASGQWRFATAGQEQSYGIKADGTLWAWGSAEYGELGIGTNSPAKVSTPTQIGTDKDWKYAAGGSGRAFFIKEDGTMWSTGTFEGGVLGTGAAALQLSPVQIGTDTDWAYVATSIGGMNYDALAIKTDGTMWGWGKNHLGCLGIGNYEAQATPVQVGTDNDWVSISIGASHTLALKKDGTIWGSGNAANRALGDHTGNCTQFVKVADGNWIAAYAIDQASYAIKADGTLWAWGENYKDLLGLQLNEGEEEVSSIDTPTQITAITEKVIGFSGSQYNRVAIVGEGSVATKAYAWGYNYSGAVGNGTGTAFGDLSGLIIYTTPQEVAFEGDFEFKTVSTGQDFSIVLANDGKIYGWGSNSWGQLGTSEAENMLGNYKTSPIEVAAEPEAADPGTEFDAQSIPASLASVEKIKLTGEWSTADLLKLVAPLGNGQGAIGFNYNTALKTVDMSDATFAENTSLSTIFRNCSVLETVIFPENETVANITSLNSAFNNDVKLSYINISNLVNVSDLNMAFQRCQTLQMLNLSKWVGVEDSELAFQGCEALTTIALPGKFEIGDRCFGSCSGLTVIDWSTYEGTTAPVVEKSDKYQPFYNVDFLPEDQAKVTIIVPQDAYASFSTDSYWKGFNIQMAELPGSYTVDSESIPSSLTDAIHLTLTGTWNSTKFAALAKALGTASGIAAGNNTLVSLNMSAIAVEANTALTMKVPGALFGTSDKGVFQKYTALETIVMPAAEEAANLTNFTQAFQDCSALKSIDLSGCSAISASNDAFYNCTSLAEVKLPASIKLAREMFDRCVSLTTLDWSLYDGTEAPTYSSNALPSLADPSTLTVIVPAKAYESFLASELWNNFTIKNAESSGIIDAVTDIINTARPVYNLSGQYVTTLAPGADASSLPAGLYIIAGKKILVK